MIDSTFIQLFRQLIDLHTTCLGTSEEEDVSDGEDDDDDRFFSPSRKVGQQKDYTVITAGKSTLCTLCTVNTHFAQFVKEFVKEFDCEMSLFCRARHQQFGDGAT